MIVHFLVSNDNGQWELVCMVIGEREGANLVVQLAQFF